MDAIDDKNVFTSRTPDAVAARLSAFVSRRQSWAIKTAKLVTAVQALDGPDTRLDGGA